MPFIEVGQDNGQSVELYYEDYGSGAPVVLIHGWPLSSRAWEPQVRVLVEAGHRVITYDRRGFGKSSQPWSGYDYDTFAADLERLLTHLDAAAATLVGFSMGGGEVARYIGTYGSSRINKAVLAAAVPPYLYVSDDNPDGGVDDDTLAGFQAGVTGDRLAFLDDFSKNFFSTDQGLLVSEAMRDYAKQIAAFASPKGTLECIAAFAKTDFRADLEKFDVPTLVIHGDSDAIVPFEVSGKRSAEIIENCETTVIEGAPHGLNVSHAEQFNEALLQFLG